jgi:hypothetical protein
MKTLPLINLVSIIHLTCLSLWGGVVATEAVVELYPYRRPELHPIAAAYHYWIDLLVELPLILLVLATGLTLVILAWPLSPLHLLKISAALVAVTANLYCILLVLRRGHLTDPAVILPLTRRIIMCAVVGLPFAAVAAGAGFWLAYQRLVELVR